MRRVIVMMVATLLLMAGAWPAVAQESPASPADAFDSFEIYAQAQGGAGAFFAVGDEINRIAGAKVEMTKPAQVYTIAAAFQRGLATGYTYGAVLGKSAAGGKGIAPEPPPGEALGLYPSDPREMTWEGPITAGAKGPVIDGKAHAAATEVPTGVADIKFQHVDVPGQLTIQQGNVLARGEPVAEGVETEALSVFRNITIGPLKIESMISRAYGLVPAGSGPAQGDGGLYVDGATVNGTPVRITSRGLEVGDQVQGREQKEQLSDQVREAMKGAGYEDVKLADTEVELGEDGTSVKVITGALKVHYRSAEMKASNPQGFSGGGFEVGGATIEMKAQRHVAGSEGTGTGGGISFFSAEDSGSGAADAHPLLAGAVAFPWLAALRRCRL